MKNKVIELAIFYPYGYPWSRAKLGISVEEINEILKENGLEREDDRRKAGYEIDILCYTKAIKVSEYRELEESIIEELSNKKYISETLVKKVLSKKFLANQEELNTYVKFINNTMIIEEKKRFTRGMQFWLIDLFYYYKCSLNLELDTKEIKGFIVKLVEKNYKEINFDEKTIDKIRVSRSMNRPNVLRMITDIAKNFKGELEILVERYIEKEETKSLDTSFEDELFDMINDTPTFELNVEEDKNLDLAEVNSKKEEIKIEKSEEDKVENVEKIKVITDKVDDKIELHLKGLVEALGYKMIKCKDIEEEEELEVFMLKELASFKKGASLSELYNAYINFDNIAKENLEAVMSNFFTSLKLQGFEVDDTKSVGEEVSLDTKNLLRDFMLTSPVESKGIVKGKIKYLSWMYNGKKVTPMVVNPIKK